MRILGIDPGTTGSAALLEVADSEIILCKAISFKQEPDWLHVLYCLCVEHMHRYGIPKIDKAVIENTHSFPGQGVVSVHTFGVQKGLAIAPVTIAGIPLEQVDPQVWLTRMGLYLGKGRKESIKAQKKRVGELFSELVKDEKEENSEVVHAGVLIAFSQILHEMPELAAAYRERFAVKQANLTPEQAAWFQAKMQELLNKAEPKPKLQEFPFYGNEG